jgi:hypothetical protein
MTKKPLKTYKTLREAVKPSLKGGYDAVEYLCSIWNKVNATYEYSN